MPNATPTDTSINIMELGAKLGALEAGQEALGAGQRALELGQKVLEAGQKSLEQKVTSLEVGQKALEAGQKNLEQKVTSLEVGQKALEAGQKNLEQKVGALEVGQKSLEQKVGSLETIQRRMEEELKALTVDVKGLMKFMWAGMGVLTVTTTVLPVVFRYFPPQQTSFLPGSHHQVPVTEPFSQDVVAFSELGQVPVHVPGGKPVGKAV